MARVSSNLDISFIDNIQETFSDTLVIPVFEGNELGPAGQRLNERYCHFISERLNTLRQFDIYFSPNAQKIPYFEGKFNQAIQFSAPDESDFTSVTLLGMGRSDTFNLKSVKSASSCLKSVITNGDITSATLLADSMDDDPQAVHNIYTALATEIYESFYSFDKYKTQKPDISKQRQMQILIENPESASALFSKASILSRAKMWAQDLTNEPPNKLYPEKYARQIRDELAPFGVKVTIIDHKEMKDKDMRLALAVGESSDNKPCMVIMEWDGLDGSCDMPVGLVGKGVTMDTGGINIKTANMEKMKMDMAGSAAVVGCMKALAEQNSASHVVAIVGLTENRPTGNAYLPGDIIVSLSGQSIEIINTDAEGRLVLADAMTYLQRSYNLCAIVDVATLTGACIKAHGYEQAGFFTNNESLAEEFKNAADKSDELIAYDPIEPKHKSFIQGQISDLKNRGGTPEDGHITAAAFLEHFVEKGKNWAHIDIAGTAIPPGGLASGYGVKLLTQWIKDNYTNDNADIPPPGMHAH